MASAARSSRLELRVAPDEKALVDQAAILNGNSTADFVRSTMLTVARETIRQQKVIELTMEGSRIFVEALINPPEPNERLRALAKEFETTSAH